MFKRIGQMVHAQLHVARVGIHDFGYLMNVLPVLWHENARK